jgi:hypothetical protein
MDTQIHKQRWMPLKHFILDQVHQPSHLIKSQSIAHPTDLFSYTKTEKIVLLLLLTHFIEKRGFIERKHPKLVSCFSSRL